MPAAVSLAVAVALLLAPPDDLARTLPVEDAFYALSVAREAATGGGITIDGRTPTNGFQPLWVALNVPVYALVGGERIDGLRLSQVLSTLLWLAFAGLLALQARDLARRHGLEGRMAAAAAAIVAVGSVSVLRLFRNGLETGLVLVLLAAAVIVLDRWTTWSARRIALAGVLLGALAWARLDAALFALAFGAVVLRRDRRRAVAPLAACALAALLLVPWLAYNVALDGSVVPSGGRSQAGAYDPAHNVASALRAIGAWTLAPLLRAGMHLQPVPYTEILAIAGIALTALAVRYVRRGRRLPIGSGTLALAAYAGLLVGWYTLAFGSWWFLDRYLAPLLLVAVPWLACALERLGRRWTLPALTGVVLVANVPVLAVLLTAPHWPPPWWTSPASNLGSHPNLNHEFQLAWTRAHVREECRVGAFESGTLGYFREEVVNLDGKVNSAALRARRAGRSGEYVLRTGIDVMVDIPSEPLHSELGRRGWRRVADMGRYETWVRPGGAHCLQPQPTEQRARQVAEDREDPAQHGRRPHRVGAPA